MCKIRNALRRTVEGHITHSRRKKLLNKTKTLKTPEKFCNVRLPYKYK